MSARAKVATSEPGLPNLLPPHWKNEIARYLEVDMPKWDVGGFVGQFPQWFLEHMAKHSQSDFSD